MQDARPVGRVGFLFTDLEGSTRLLRRLGDEGYAAVLARHDRSIRDAVAHFGGEVVDTQGDAFFAAFSQPASAVRAAVAAQQALAAQPWPQGVRVAVRMGAHVGLRQRSGHRYLGLDVHLAARICAAANGGQVFVSNAMRGAVWDDPDAPELVELGGHRLKDFDEPQAIYLAVVPGIPLHQRPPRPMGGAADGAFAGRETELADAAATMMVRRARRQERRRMLGVLGAIAVVGGVIAAYEASRTAPIQIATNSIAEIDPRTGRVVADLPIGSSPTAIAEAAGDVWVVSRAGTLTRIDERTRRVTQVAGQLGRRPPTDVAAGLGKVWVVNGFDRTVTVLDAPSGRFLQTLRLPTHVGVLGVPDSRAAAGAGGVWVDNGGGAGVTPFVGGIRRATLRPLPTGAIAVAGGAVWVGSRTNYFGKPGLVEIDPSARRVRGRVRIGELDAMAPGEHALWVADGAAGTLERVDAATRRITDRVQVGRGITALAARGGSVWAANARTATLLRVDIRHHRVVARIRLAREPDALVGSRTGIWVAALGPPKPAPATAGVRIAEAPDAVSSLDPATAFSADEWQILSATDLNLVRYADGRGRSGPRIVPDAATALPTLSDGGRTATFVLRPHLRFSPPAGPPVTAASFRDAIERTVRSTSPWAGFAFDFAGVRAFQHGLTPHIAGIRVHGARLSITRTRRAGDLLPRLAMPFFAAVPNDAPPPGSGPLASAGPYYIRSDVPGRTIVLARNPGYAGLRRGRLRRLTVVLAGHPSGWQLLRSGHAAYAPDAAPPAAALRTLIARAGPGSPDARAGRQSVFIEPTANLFFVAINGHRGVFANRDLRRAINDAIDRTALAATLGPGGGRPTDQYLTPSVAGYPGSGHVYPLHAPAVAAARRLVRRSGVATPVQASLYTVKGDLGAARRTAILRRDLARIGIVVHPRLVPASVHANAVDHPPPNALDDFGFQFLWPEPAWLLVRTPILDEGGFAHRFARANDLTGDARSQAFGRLELRLARDAAPLAAYAYATKVDLFGPGVGCQVYQPGFGIDLARLCSR